MKAMTGLSVISPTLDSEAAEDKAPTKIPFLQAAWAITYKDLLAEFRSRELISAMGLFAMLSVLIFSFALQLDRTVRQEVISGVLWVTVAFASILGLNRSLSMERDRGSLDALLMAPIDRSAIFFGKLTGNFLFALITGLLLLPIMTILYNIPVLQGWLIVVLILGTLGFSTVGTLLATMTVHTRSRDAMLPIVMLPIALPIILTAVNASTGILSGLPLSDWQTWINLLLVVNIVYLVLCYVLFEHVIEE